MNIGIINVSKSHVAYRDFMTKIEACNSEEELESVSDAVEDCYLAGILTNSAYSALSEALDDRLMTLVEKELI